MATADLQAPADLSHPPSTSPTGQPANQRRPKGALRQFAEGLASLRLTVTLFVLSMFLIFAGTLAQVDRDIWYVVEEGYFRVWLAEIEWRALMRFVEKFVYDFGVADSLQGGFYFPGGWTIGAVMFVNLLAAHALRFKIAANGARLAAGLLTIALGLLATALVIQSGMVEGAGLKSELSPVVAD